MAKSEELASGKIRVSLDLSMPLFNRLEELEEITQESKAGIIRQALQLYEYVVRRTVEGYSFKAVDQEGKEESLVFLGSSNISSPKKRSTPAEEEALV